MMMNLSHPIVGICLIAGLSLMAGGCRQQSAIGPSVTGLSETDASHPNAQRLASNNGAATTPSNALPASTAAGEQQAADGSADSTHPIDQLAEGKRFRAATRALDKGDIQTVTQIRDELRSSPYSPLATALDALILVKQEQYEQAITLAEELSAIPVMQPEAYTIAGEVFQRQNRWTEAINAFSNALAINPRHVRAHMWLGAIYYDIGAMKTANEHLRAAAELDPQEINALLLSGRIHQDYEQYEEAVKDYRQVLRRMNSEETSLPVRIRLAQCLVELRQLTDARETLESCPDIPEVIAVRAAIEEADGQFSAAAKLARDALQEQSENRTAGMVLARILVTEKRWDEAQEILEQLVESDPYDHEPKLLLGRAMVGGGEVEQGEQQIREAAELKDTFLQFAELHQQAMREPENVEIRQQLGRLAEKLGKPKLAESWYRSADALQATEPPSSDDDEF